MKDNKYAPYVLGPVLLLVWGLIFYKIYQAVYDGEETFVVPEYRTIPVYEERPQDDFYALLVDYKDPFLGKRFDYTTNGNRSSKTTTSRGNSNRPNRNTKIIQPIKKNTPKKPFPTVVFQGFQVMELDTVALLKVNNRFYPTARKGDAYQGIKVKAIYKDSICLEFESQVQTIIRKNR